jgi:hypothetical protein
MDESKPNKRITKTNIIEIVFMILLSRIKKHQGGKADHNAKYRTAYGEPKGDIPTRVRAEVR